MRIIALTINKTENMGKIRFFILSFFMLLNGFLSLAQAKIKKPVKQLQKTVKVPKKAPVVAKVPVRAVAKPLPVKPLPKRNLLTQKMKISRQQINFYAKKKIIPVHSPLVKTIPLKPTSQRRFVIKHDVANKAKHKAASIKLARVTNVKKNRFTIKKKAEKEEVLMAKKEKKPKKVPRFEIQKVEKNVVPIGVETVVEQKTTEVKPTEKATIEQKIETFNETTENTLSPEEARSQFELGRKMFAKLDSMQTDVDPSQALKLMEAAARGRNQDALWFLGSSYMSGSKYMLKDTKAAKYWFQKYKESVGAKP